MTEIFHTMMNFMNKGGLFMWPLLACSIVSLTTIILRIFALREKNVLPITVEGTVRTTCMFGELNVQLSLAPPPGAGQVGEDCCGLGRE